MAEGSATVGEETPSHLTTDFIHFVLDGITEEFCKSLNTDKVLRRLISKHHLSSDDVSEINHSPRMDQRVEKLLSLLRVCEPPEAYVDFRDAMHEFRIDLFEHMEEVERHYNNGARAKRPKQAAAGESSQGSSSANSGAKSSSAGGDKRYQYVPPGAGSQFNQQANMNFQKFDLRATQINVHGRCVNIEGDQTIVHGNVYQFPGNVTIYKDKAYGDKPYKKK